MRFDWYAATIQEHPQELVQILAADLGGQTPTSGRGMHGYTQTFTIADKQGRTLANVLAGGRNPDPHAWASSDATDAFYEVIRARWPDRHHVTRLDSAEDFTTPGGYERMRSSMREIIKGKGVTGREIVPESIQEGRTFYGGSPKSDVRVRLYEKGKQIRALFGGAFPAGEVIMADKRFELDDWTRLEVQVRPQKQARKTAAYVTPSMGWAFASWTSAVAQEVMGLELERIQVRAWDEPDDERAFRYMLRQYGPLLRRMKHEAGSWRTVGSTIGEAMDKLPHG